MTKESKKGNGAMSLIERYLAAVAAQLNPDQREDVVAELRDDLMSRIEAREAELGRSLTDDETEAVLRELGHPLAVAARYGSGPQHLIGPELFPWWLFAMKVGLAAMALLSVIGLGGRVLGGMDVGQAFAQALGGFIEGGLTLLGLVTVLGFVWERYGGKPGFITNWRVRDLGLFELGRLNADTWGKAMQSGQPKVVYVDATGSRMSPVARALASATAMAVFLLWWVGALRLGGTGVEDIEALVWGVDYTAAVQAVIAALWWPVVVYGVCRVAFDLFRALRPRAVRMAALGDIGLACARAVGAAWVLFVSPLGVQLEASTPGAAFEQVRDVIRNGGWDVEVTVIVILGFIILEAAARVLISLGRLATGRDRRVDQL